MKIEEMIRDYRDTHEIGRLDMFEELAYRYYQQHVELAALREKVARLEDLESAKKQCEVLLKEADVLFNQEHELCDDANSDEWLWKWKVRYYFEETDIPPHPIPDDMRGEG